MRTRLRDIATFLACLLWTAAGLVLLAVLLPTVERPTVDALVLAGGAAALALAFSTLQVEFRHDGQRLEVAPDAGFLVIVAVAVQPPVAALVGGVAVLWAVRRAGTTLERAFLVASGALAAGTASLVAHDVLGAATAATADPRLVVAAVLAAATTRALVVVTGQTLLAESRARGGALSVLRGLPIATILALQVGLPTAAAAVAAPFLEHPPLALLVVLAGQLLTWCVLRIQHQQFRGTQVTADLLETFHRYVPQHVAAGVLAHDGDAGGGAHVSLAGEHRDITVLFIDVRGFTSWSERTPASEVLAELNRLLGELADAILATDGTIDKFTGDGLMAIWNAPADQPDHALRAVQTLPKLLMRVREFNIRREVQRSTPLDVGIGIASGPAMVGNIGHRDRLAYTAIGDTVNLAARLEAATRAQEVPALIDEGTFLALPPQVQRQFHRLDAIVVKGRSERVRSYTPVALLRHGQNPATSRRGHGIVTPRGSDVA